MEINTDMRQEEFLTCFQEALTGKVSDRIIQENVNYYQSYINNEIRNGKTEEEVLRALGDPRLLAKTIEESNKFANGEESYEYDNSGWGYQGNRNGQGTREQDYMNQHKTIQFPGWIVGIVIIAVLALAILLVFSVLSFLAPVIVGLAVGILIYKLFTGGWQRKY